MKTADKWGTSYPMRALIREVQRDVLTEVVGWLSEEAGLCHKQEDVCDALLRAAKKFSERARELP